MLAHPPFPITDRTAPILRLLGRLEFVPTAAIHRLIGPARARFTISTWLNALHQQRLIWRVAVEPWRVPGSQSRISRRPAPRDPLVWGLTPQGRDWLREQQVEDDPSVPDRVITRDWKRPELRLGQLAHDLLVVNWCCAALDELRQHPLVRCVEVIPEYVSATNAAGQAIQRFDALVHVGLAHPTRGADRDLGPIPWGHPRRDDPAQVAWAIEVDRGTEKLVTLLGKAVMYRDLTRSGHYRATIGADPLPIVLAPNPRRAGQIAREWLDGWPGGRGVFAPFTAAGADGVLWQRYKALGVNPTYDTTLWADVGLTRERWMQTLEQPTGQG